MVLSQFAAVPSRCQMQIEYFTGYEHGGNTITTTTQHEGCGYTSQLMSPPLGWSGPITTVTRGAHGAYVLRQSVGKDGNTYWGIGVPSDSGIPNSGFTSNPVHFSFFYRHNNSRADTTTPVPQYGVFGVGYAGTRYCELTIQFPSGSDYFVLKDSTGAAVATGTTSIQSNTWYWIRMSVYKGATQADNYVKLYIDDTQEFDYSNINLGAFSTVRCYMGGRWDPRTGHGGIQFKEYYDDLVVGDDWMPSDDYFVVYMFPNANGDYHPEGWWAPVSYLEVVDRPHDSGVTIVGPIEEAAEGAWWFAHVEPCSTAGESTGVEPKIYAVRNMIISRGGGFGASNKAKIRLKLDANIDDSPSSRLLLAKYVGQTRVYQLNPWTGEAWTTGMLNDLEVGTYVEQEDPYWMTQCGIHVLFGARGSYPANVPKVFNNFGR